MRGVTPKSAGGGGKVAEGVERLLTVMANLYCVSNPDGSWVLVDTGIPFSTGRILRWIAQQKSANAKPVCVLLTHGHFDHVGSVRQLARRWNVLVYAHRMEKPYLTGKAKYPPGDPTVGKGAFSLFAPIYPRGPIDISERLRELPKDGAVPGLPGWRWIATPGHSPGHVSFFRERDRLLIAGDAFATTKQESVTSVITQRLEIQGPPAYFTMDWDEAKKSVARLAELRPGVAACGHGTPMGGPDTAPALDALANGFDQIARPAHGRYVRQPAVANENGIVSVPPPVLNLNVKLALGAAAAGAIIALWASKRGD